MRVLINTFCTLQTRTGIGHYTSHLASALLGVAGEDEVGFYPSGWFEPLARFYLQQAQRYERYRRQTGWTGFLRSRTLGRFLSLLRFASRLFVPNPFQSTARRGGYDLYHEPNFLPEVCDLPTVVTVHDLSVLLHPEWHPPQRVAEFNRHFQAGLTRATHLLAISEFTRQEIIRHLGWPPDRVSVTYMGRRPELRRLSPEECLPVLQSWNLAPGYLLHVGTLEPRKNVRMLLELYCSLPISLRERCPLVLAGPAGWNSEDLIGFLRREGHQHNIRWLGYVADDQFSALYSAARALVFPTFYEGFGIPTIEMMACGGAVLASTTPAVAETVGGKAHLLDPRDADGWRAALVRICTDDDWLRALRHGAEEFARPFTWERCARDTLAAYRHVLGKHRLACAA
jgi:alpha-1,3-rhamnosyl/mannosyltransferase